MNLNRYLCSTEELYLIHKVSSLKFVNFLSFPSGLLRGDSLYFIGPEGEAYTDYDPVFNYMRFFVFAAIQGTHPDLPAFTELFNLSPPIGKRKGSAVVMLK